MNAYKVYPNTTSLPAEDELYRSATALQLVTSLHSDPPHATPLNTHIDKFSNRTYDLVFERSQR